ncbi:GNAT family N-acetyltransferase [Nocardia sp. NPDC050175]|uniref:GNAT family N-acetyltransferase n=1 Tax=Nocardia sp. NPDC050175 TaxID=3364317 RepID=UPI0037970BCA
MTTDTEHATRFRPLVEGDLVEVQAIYNHAVRYTDATLDHEEKSLDELRSWLVAHNYRYLALGAQNAKGRLVGYGTLSPFSSRMGYLASAELSIYIHPDGKGRGVGGGLCARLTDYASLAGMSAVVAFVSTSNEASRRMLSRSGYQVEGKLRQIGYKAGQLIDLEIFQRVFDANCARYDGTTLTELITAFNEELPR